MLADRALTQEDDVEVVRLLDDALKDARILMLRPPAQDGKDLD